MSSFTETGAQIGVIPEREHSPAYPSNIFELRAFVEMLANEQKQAFHSIYDLTFEQAPVTFLHSEAAAHVARMMKKKEGFVMQRREALIVEDIVRDEDSSYNFERSNRSAPDPDFDAFKKLDEMYPIEKCDFQSPLEKTPMEPFLTPRGKYSVAFPNAASFAGFHGLVVVPHLHKPDELTREYFVDMMETGGVWSQRVLEYTQERQEEYPFPIVYSSFGMNIYPPAGGSQLHPHIQLEQTIKPDKVTRRFRKGMADHKWYQQEVILRAMRGQDQEAPTYFDQLAEVYEPIGLRFGMGTADILVDLTPRRNYGVIVRQRTYDNLPNQDFSAATFVALDWLWRKEKVSSANFRVYCPPLNADTTQSGDWYKFPVFARITARAPVGSPISDVGYKELYGTPVIGTDPFKLAGSLREHLMERRSA